MLNGPSNSDELLQSLTGQTIRGVFRGPKENDIYLVLDGGEAICFSGETTFWKAERAEVQLLVQERTRIIRELIQELDALVSLAGITV